MRVFTHSVLSIIVVHIFLLKNHITSFIFFLATEIQNRYKNKKKILFRFDSLHIIKAVLSPFGITEVNNDLKLYML